jgi:hypothetical protein
MREWGKGTSREVWMLLTASLNSGVSARSFLSTSVYISKALFPLSQAPSTSFCKYFRWCHLTGFLVVGRSRAPWGFFPSYFHVCMSSVPRKPRFLSLYKWYSFKISLYKEYTFRIMMVKILGLNMKLLVFNYIFLAKIWLSLKIKIRYMQKELEPLHHPFLCWLFLRWGGLALCPGWPGPQFYLCFPV